MWEHSGAAVKCNEEDDEALMQESLWGCFVSGAAAANTGSFRNVWKDALSGLNFLLAGLYEA